MQTITICTDAGHQNFYKQSLAAWACYIRTPSQTIRYSGTMKNPCKGSSQAELYAIANALYLLAKDYDLTRYKVILYSDNTWALRNHVDGSMKKVKKEWKDVYDKHIRPYIKAANAYEARHVKAHLPPAQWGFGTARFYMQDWCDKEVHRVMHTARGEVLKNLNHKQNSPCVSGQKRA